MRQELWTTRVRLAAVLAALAIAGPAGARDLVWDYNGASLNDGVPQDGSGTWDNTTPNWVDPAAPADH